MDERERNQDIDDFCEQVDRSLLPSCRIWLDDEEDPVVVEHVPEPWKLVGRGNYAAVVAHPDFPQLVVKLYALAKDADDNAELPLLTEIAEELQVYQKIGEHPAFSCCYAHGPRYLVLKRLSGMTLYECVIKGVRVEKQVFLDVDQALAYARHIGLYPHDVHGKNILMHEGRGYVVDVSDFYIEEPCKMWDDLKKSYERFYLRTLYRWPIPVPEWLLNAVRKGYRFYRKRIRKKT
jgi:hypothetical protein